MATINDLPVEILEQIFGILAPSRRTKDDPNTCLAGLAPVCRRWQAIIEPRTFGKICLKPSNIDGTDDVSSFCCLFSSQNRRRRRYITNLELDFDFFTSPYTLPEHFYGSTAQRLLMALLLVNRGDAPPVCLLEFENEMWNCNLRMTTFLVRVFDILGRWKMTEVRPGGINLILHDTYRSDWQIMADELRRWPAAELAYGVKGPPLLPAFYHVPISDEEREDALPAASNNFYRTLNLDFSDS